MASKQHPALLYFRPNQDNIWRWSSDGELIEWSHKGTIAYNEEILDTLKILEPNGLPSFYCIVLCLCALSKNWSPNVPILSQKMVGFLKNQSDNTQDIISLVDDITTKLNAIHKYYQDNTPHNKPSIISYLLEACPAHYDQEASNDIINAFNVYFPDTERGLWENHNSPHEFYSAINDLNRALSEANPSDIENVLDTGISQLKPDAVLDLPTIDERILTAIRDIENEGEWNGFRDLINAIRASIQIPRQLSHPNDLKDGGFSDINNKGTPDRLLISELANDEDVLLTRLALNEALYLERETPKDTIKISRNFYIENGVRMWGLPRVYSLAIAISLSLGFDNEEGVNWYSLKGKESEPIHLDSHAGIKKALEDLHHSPYLTAEIDSIEDRSSENILICHSQSYFDDQNQAWFLSFIEQFTYIIHIERNGNYTFLQPSLNGKKIIKQASLDLDKIFLNESDQNLYNNRNETSELPHCLSKRPFPLRIKHKPDPRVSYWENGNYSITDTGELILHDRIACGATILDNFSNFPDYYYLCPHHDSNISMVSINKLARHKYEVEVIEYDCLNKQQTDTWSRIVPCSVPLSACFKDGHIIIAGDNGAFLIHKEHKELCFHYDQIITKCYDAQHFEHDNRWYKLFIKQSKGTVLSSSVIYQETMGNESKAHICYSVPGKDGIWILNKNMEVCNQQGHVIGKYNLQDLSTSEVKWISPDHTYICFSSNNKLRTIRNIDNPKLSPKADNYLFPMETSNLLKNKQSTRSKFIAFAIKNDRLYLKSHKHQILMLDTTCSNTVWRQTEDSVNLTWKSFATCSLDRNLINTDDFGGYSLWISTRGILVIQAPESWALLTIQDGQCAVTLSSGESGGRRFFLIRESCSYSVPAKLNAMLRKFENQL